MEAELRYGVRLKDLDPDLRDDMQYVWDALGAVKVSLSVLDMTAGRVLSDLAKTELPRLCPAAAG
jgi:hypothetical protein